MGASLICLVTIHGVGFQQAPDPTNNIPGYADTLHEHLAQYLDASLLGDDPQRTRSRRGEAGPVYVESDCTAGQVDEGSPRLDRCLWHGVRRWL